MLSVSTLRGVCARTKGLLPRMASRSMAGPAKAAPAFNYTDLFVTEKPKETPYKLLTTDHVSTFTVNGEKMLKVRPRLLKECLSQLVGAVSICVPQRRLGSQQAPPLGTCIWHASDRQPAAVLLVYTSRRMRQRRNCAVSKPAQLAERNRPLALSSTSQLANEPYSDS